MAIGLNIDEGIGGNYGKFERFYIAVDPRKITFLDCFY
jgi:hypothetical protein